MNEIMVSEQNLSTAKSCQKYRTKNQNAADISDSAANITHLSVITASPYNHALSLYENDTAYLQKLTGAENLTFKDGKLFFKGSALTPLTVAELKDIQTKEGVEDIDLPFLQAIYSIILKDCEDSGYKPKDVITVYLPDMMKMLKLPNNPAQKDSIIKALSSYQTVAGFIQGRYKTPSIFPVLLFEGYNSENNTISFSSPYLRNIIREIVAKFSRKDKQDKPLLKTNGLPQMKVSHSYLVKAELAKERNKEAAVNVMLIVSVIERAGSRGAVPHISASTLIEQNTALKIRLENSKNQSQLLKRVFTKTWQLLRTHTELLNTYKDIQLPNETDPCYIPTMKTLRRLVFEFPHKGKIRTEKSS